VAQKREKPAPEYKDTNTFLYTPRYSYSQPVKNRFLFFWSIAKKYRAAINYAASLSAPNIICCLYLVGDADLDKVEKYLKDQPGNLLVLIGKPNNSLINSIDDALHTLKLNENIGRHWDDERDIARVKAMLERNRAAVANHVVSEEDVASFIEHDEGFLDAVHDRAALFERFMAEWSEGLTAVGCHTGVIASSMETHDDALFEIAKEIYPLGVEAASPSGKPYGQTKAAALCQDAMSGKPVFNLDPGDVPSKPKCALEMFDVKRQSEAPVASYRDKREASGQTGIDENAIWRCIVGRTRSVKHGNTRVTFREVMPPNGIALRFASDVYEYANRALIDNGMIDIVDLQKHFSAPPYGYYYSNWYNAMLGAAFSRYTSGNYFMFVGVTYFPVTPNDLATITKEFVMAAHRRRSCALFRLSTAQRDFVRLLKKLFGIRLKDDTLIEFQLFARRWCENHMRISSIYCVDDTLAHLLNGEDLFSISIGFETAYDYVKSHFDELKHQLFHADDALYEQIIREYDVPFADYYRAYCLKSYTNHCRGWLWRKETLWGEIKLRKAIFDAENAGTSLSGEQLYRLQR